MTCACGTVSCYVCRQELKKGLGYMHFCQVPNCNHENCGKCPLFTNSVQDDTIAMREAGLKAMSENEDAKVILRDDAKQVDIDALLEENSEEARRYDRVAAAAQRQAHLGIGAMARAAYAEVNARDNNRGEARRRADNGRRNEERGLLGRLFSRK